MDTGRGFANPGRVAWRRVSVERPENPVILGINTDDVSKLCISRCIVN